MTLIELKNINKSFGKKDLFKNVNLQINKGENIGLIGAKGIGKSTLLKISCGLGEVDLGNIEYFFKYKKKPIEKTDFLFPESTYPSMFKTKDIIDIISRNIKNKDHLEYLIDLMDIKSMLNRKTFKLSGGKNQKSNLLVAMAEEPEILMLDEFSTSLDIKAKKNIIDYFKKIKLEKGITSIIISHDINEILEICSHIVLIKNQEIGKKIKINKKTTHHSILKLL